MPKINILPEYIANKIAAGEVVQRAASVVKELIENSLDAQAQNLTIDIKKGGKELIAILDDGCGMDEEDAKNCLLRHATSKIKTDEDLFLIKNYGFRGEALPSIASVSKLELETSFKDASQGVKIVVEGGSVNSFTHCPPLGGTYIKIYDLFFNTPARRKFQKTISVEFNAIVDTVYNQAIVSNDVSFTLLHDGKVFLKSPQRQDRLLRIADLYGESLSQEMVNFEYQDEMIKVSGYISKPSMTRSNRNMQKFFVNNRNVKNKSISFALFDAYKDIIPSGRHSVAFLFIDVPYEFVDVNVHPSKDEVKFQDEQFVAHSVRQSLKKAVEKMISKPLDVTEPVIYNDFAVKENSWKVQESRPDFEPTQERVMQSTLDFYKTQTAEPHRDMPWQVSTPKSLTEIRRDVTGSFSTMLLFNQLYVVTVIDGKLCIVDQHAAHERVLYEKFKKTLVEGAGASQDLLFPITLEILPNHISYFEVIAPELNKLGFSIEHFGGNDFVLRSVPVYIKENKIKQTINDMLDDLALLGYSSKKVLENFDNFLKIMACRCAYKAGDVVPNEVLQAIIKEFLENGILQCPHGRPAIIKFSDKDLEKMFHRS